MEARIFSLRGERVLISTDLARLYGVKPKALLRAVQRNKDRFPADFVFSVSPTEWANLKSQFVTSSWGGLRRALPYAFTEQGVAMLSSVLHSPRAIDVNVEVMRTFVRLRRLAGSHADLARRFEELEQEVRRELQGRVRRNSAADGTADEGTAADRVPTGVERSISGLSR